MTILFFLTAGERRSAQDICEHLSGAAGSLSGPAKRSDVRAAAAILHW